MHEDDRRVRQIRVLAAALFALSLLVVLVSAYIRLKGSGLGCAPWPDCYGAILAGGALPHADQARILHRAVASLTLLLGFVLLWRCQRPSPLHGPRRLATALLALMILLTLVGVFSASPQRAWAGFINILGGAGLVLLTAATWQVVGVAQHTAQRRPAALLHVGLGVLLLTLVTGALIGARYAGPACPALPGCGVPLAPTFGLDALNPLVTIAEPMRYGDAGGVLLHLLHRSFSLASVVLLGFAGLRALAVPGARPVALAMLAVLLVQFGLGIAIVMGGFALDMTVAHNLGAALLLACGFVLLRQMKYRIA